MKRINLLDKHIAELIAAGEVVERPASVVKELMENSIDAGASKITVEIRNGGVSMIKISDNGSGIHKDDVRLAFLRHSTSKIRDAEDLDSISTLGFRGEALCSIATVSRVELITVREGENLGVRYLIEGGEEKIFEEAGRAHGTTFTVRDLFFNTPARMKFLKKDVAEGNAIAGIIDKIAMSHPEISVSFIRDGKIVMNTQGNGKISSCIYSIYGKDIFEKMIPVDYKLNGITVSGFINRPESARPSRTLQNFFINHRFARIKVAATALEEAFKGFITVGKHPICAIYIDIPYGAVDVNVHPSKTEVRFVNEKPIFEAVYYGVKSALMGDNRKKELKFTLSKSKIESEEEKTKGNKEEQEEKQEENKDIVTNDSLKVKTDNYYQTGVQMQQFSNREYKREVSYPDMSKITKDSNLNLEFEEKSKNFYPKIEKEEIDEANKENENKERKIEKDEMEKNKIEKNKIEKDYNEVFSIQRDVKPMYINKDTEKNLEILPNLNIKNKKNVSLDIEVDDFYENEECKSEENEAENVSLNNFEIEKNKEKKILGEIFDCYILLQEDNKLIFIDKHAAHERILYNELRENGKGQGVDSQMLLKPIVVSLDKESYSEVTENTLLLEKAGYQVEDFGNGTVIVRSAPVYLDISDVESSVIEIAEYIRDNKMSIDTEYLDWIYHNVACRAAVKAGRKSSEREIKGLVESLEENPNVMYCPHGRPVYIELCKKDIEKQFGRNG